MHANERVQCEQCDYVTHNQINLYNHVKTRNAYCYRHKNSCSIGIYTYSLLSDIL